MLVPHVTMLDILDPNTTWDKRGIRVCSEKLKMKFEYDVEIKFGPLRRVTCSL